MKRNGKYLRLLIFIALEVLNYWYFKVKNLEMFFFGWTLFYLFLLIYNVFNIVADGKSRSVGGGGLYGGNSALNELRAEEAFAGTTQQRRDGGGIKDPVNLLFLALFIANAVCYIVVMPK